MKLISRFALTTLLALIAMPTLARGWTDHERTLINAARCSRMRVTVITNQEDSIILRQVAQPLSRREVQSVEFARLAASMIETVNDPQNAGVGIAAPQVGISRRMVIVQRVDKTGTPFEVYVNPRIVERSEELAIGGEGCLSVPDRRGNVPRATWIELEYRDPISYELVRERIEGFAAIIFQHELDHLDGVLYIDREVEVCPE